MLKIAEVMAIGSTYIVVSAGAMRGNGFTMVMMWIKNDELC